MGLKGHGIQARTLLRLMIAEGDDRPTSKGSRQFVSLLGKMQLTLIVLSASTNDPQSSNYQRQQFANTIIRKDNNFQRR